MIKYFVLNSVMALCLTLSSPLFAQSPEETEAPKERFFTFAPGYSFQQGRDEGMSPLIYSGNHFSGNLGLEKTKNQQFNKLQIGVDMGRMRPPTQPKPLRNSALSLRLQMDYTHERLLKTWRDDNLEFYLGGSWNNLMNIILNRNYVNNSFNYAFSSSIGPSGRIRYRFKIKERSFRIYAQLQVPLVAFNLRPSYASSIPEGYIAQERSNVRAFFDSGQLQTLNRFFRIRNELGLHHQLTNGNQVFLTYRWDYYSIRQHHTVQMAVHQILLGWRYNF